jgi:hypothetical protein
MEIQASEEGEEDNGCPLFRSYAGTTRIRFKGPAHRHLSAVRRPPRNGIIFSGKVVSVKAKAPICRQCLTLGLTALPRFTAPIFAVEVDAIILMTRLGKACPLTKPT